MGQGRANVGDNRGGAGEQRGLSDVRQCRDQDLADAKLGGVIEGAKDAGGAFRYSGGAGEPRDRLVRRRLCSRLGVLSVGAAVPAARKPPSAPGIRPGWGPSSAQLAGHAISARAAVVCVESLAPPLKQVQTEVPSGLALRAKTAVGATARET